MKRIEFFIIAILLCFNANGKNHHFRHIGIADGLSQVCIYSIYQDELGTVWVGTSEGLNRYNGENAKAFSLSSAGLGIPNREISRVTGDKNGHLYILSGRNLVMMDIYHEKFQVLIRDKARAFCCHKDTLWVACGNEICKFVPGRDNIPQKVGDLSNKGSCVDMLVEGDSLYIATYDRLIAAPCNDVNEHREMLKYQRGRCLTHDSSGNFWVGTWEGLYLLERDGTVRIFKSDEGTISDNQVRAVLEDSSQKIWIGTFKGLDSYDPESNSWEHFTGYGSYANTLSHNSVLALHKDMQDNIWVGTYYGGINIFNPNDENNIFFHSEPHIESSLSFPVVGKMTEDELGNIWICTEGGGLNRYDAENGDFTRLMHMEGNGRSIGSNNLKSILYREKNNRLYVGTHLGGLYIHDPSTGKGYTLHHVKGDKTSLPHEIINDIQNYKRGLALLTQGGPTFMDPVSEKFYPLINNADINKILNREFQWETFLIDRKDRMWLASTENGILCVDLVTSQMTRYDQGALGMSKTVHIYEDRYGDIWFSTIGSGVLRFQEKDGSFIGYDTDNCLPSNYCYYITGGRDNDELYILHSDGFSIFDVGSSSVMGTYNLMEQTYAQGSAIFRSSNGYVFISGTNGLSAFREKNLENKTETRLSYDKLWIHNDEIEPDDHTGILDCIVAKTESIKLRYNQNNITVEFITHDFTNKSKDLKYEYLLEGFDNNWTRTSTRSITYTKLRPGNYTLRTRAVDEPDSEIALGIRIKAPFYSSIWAYLIYVILAGLICWILVRLYIRHVTLKQSLGYEIKEKEHIEKMNEEKLRFFMNISHEFITPLTLIIGQIEIMMQKEDLSNQINKRIQRIYRNAWHMRNLISELLDFRKQEQGYLKLKIEEGNLVSFTRQIYMCFNEFAQKKDMTYRFECTESSISAWFDPRQLQKVIFNLISNAFKYSHDNGTITVEVKRSNNNAIVSVTDSGIGIPEEELSRIFERFYRGNGSSTKTTGTGLGLSLSKGIIDMHHGSIEVNSKEGQGSRFSFTLPLGNRHFTVEELANQNADEIAAHDVPLMEIPMTEMSDTCNFEEEETTTEYSHSEIGLVPSVLIVDENAELVTMLKDIFSQKYTVYTALSGHEGFNIVQTNQPDLVICDVAIADMSGKDLCYRIKNNVSLSHISVVLLTAQTSPDYMVEGFMFGADDYITKPFDVRILMARCDNLIRNKRRLWNHLGSKQHKVESSMVGVVSERDRKFMDKCIKVIKANFTNPEFGVTTLASELCISRSKLYLQFKQLTGLTPNEFINKVKLDEAMELLKASPEYNISDISIRLGFSSPRYFSRTFKNFFGTSPQSVRKKDK